MFGRIIAAVALGGTLALGGATAASAAPTSSVTNVNCANASKALARLAALESEAQSFVTKATAREAAATEAGHAKLARAIEKRIDRIEKRESRGVALIQRIETGCPGSTATPPSGASS